MCSESGLILFTLFPAAGFWESQEPQKALRRLLQRSGSKTDAEMGTWGEPLRRRQSDNVLPSQLRCPQNQIPAQLHSSRETEAHTKRYFTSKEVIILVGVCKVNRVKAVSRCNRLNPLTLKCLHTAVYNFISKNPCFMYTPKGMPKTHRNPRPDF